MVVYHAYRRSLVLKVVNLFTLRPSVPDGRWLVTVGCWQAVTRGRSQEIVCLVHRIISGCKIINCCVEKL
jgi:hypothetical protein